MSTVTQQSAKEDNERLMTSLTISKELWKRVKIAAAEHDTSAGQIVADGLELALKRLASKKGKAA